MRKYMMTMIEAFLTNQTKTYTSCSVVDGVFYSYRTPIAVRLNENGIDTVYLTLDKFSKTTTTQQRALLKSLDKICYLGGKVNVVEHDKVLEKLKTKA